MANQFLEKLYKSKLGKEEIAPSDELWKNIANEVNSKKKPNGYIGLLSILGVAAIIGTSIFFFQNKEDQEIQKTTTSSFEPVKESIETKKEIQLENIDVPTFENNIENTVSTKSKSNSAKSTNQPIIEKSTVKNTSENTSLIKDASFTKTKILEKPTTSVIHKDVKEPKTSKTIILYEVDTTFVSDTIRSY